MWNIFIVVFAVSVCILAFYITLESLKKLKTDVIPYYPFGLFFPGAGKWSIGYFLMVVLFLGLLIYLMMKGNFSFSSPA